MSNNMNMQIIYYYIYVLYIILPSHQYEKSIPKKTDQKKSSVASVLTAANRRPGSAPPDSRPFLNTTKFQTSCKV